MSIRKKLLVLLLSVSLIPLAGYFIFQISLSRIARNRIRETLRSGLEDRAEFELSRTIEHYNEHLKISAQAVRYGLQHYAGQVPKVLNSGETGAERSSEGRYLIGSSKEDLARESYKYRLADANEGGVLAVDFESLFVYGAAGESDGRLSGLTMMCRDIYSINPEGKLWIYTVLKDGITGLYPSPGVWPYARGYELREEGWYSSAKGNGRANPTLRIEPLTGKTVMTVAMGLSDVEGEFAGAVGVDIDLSGVLDRMRIPDEWQEGSWKLLLRLPRGLGAVGSEDAGIVCCTSFLESQGEGEKPSVLADVCGDEEGVRALIEESRKGNTGVVRLPYRGVDCFWAYGSSQRGGGFPILVVPYQRVVEQAHVAQQTLLRDNIRSTQVATVLIFAVIVAGVILAVMRARNVTVPVTHLAEAAGRLAEGDFDARVSISTGDELERLGEIFNSTGPKLKEMEKMQRSLELARAIQQNLLPRSAPKLDGFELAGRCRYCDETGGDYYDFIGEIGAGKVGIALGDVTGHGIGAALLMAATRSVLRSNAVAYKTELSKLFEVLNRHFESDTDYDKFITLFYGVLDCEARSLIWASGGHDPAVWYHREAEEIEELPNTGMVIGIMEDAIFECGGPVVLAKGDVVVVGTDGIWESQNEAGEVFGKERFYGIVAEGCGMGADEICGLVVDEVKLFCGDAPQLDDVTLVVIKAV